MQNLFSTITKNLPKATEQQLQSLNYNPATDSKSKAVQMSTKDLITRWQTKESPQDTQQLLNRMKPTMNSAMTSYAPGMQKALSIKAANLTLSALRSYKPDMGTDPSTYVFHNLKRLNRLNSQRSNILPVSQRAVMEARMLQQLSTEFNEQHGRQPSVGQLADLSGFNTRKVQKILDRPLVMNDSSMLSQESQQSTMSKKDLTDMDYFEYVYASVSPIDQKIMDWTSGVHGKQPLSNNAIAAKLHISPAAVSQRKSKIESMMSQVRSLL